MAKQTQDEIPGTERPRIAAIDEAAEEYREKRDERMEALKDEVELKAKLSAVMQANKDKLTEKDEDGNPMYRIPDTNECVVLEYSEANVKVKKTKEGKKAEAAAKKAEKAVQ